MQCKNIDFTSNYIKTPYAILTQDNNIPVIHAIKLIMYQLECLSIKTFHFYDWRATDLQLASRSVNTYSGKEGRSLRKP